MTIRWNLASIWLHQVKIGSLVCRSSDRLPAVFYIVRYQNNWGRAGYRLIYDLVATSRAKKLTIFKNLTDGQFVSSTKIVTASPAD